MRTIKALSHILVFLFMVVCGYSQSYHVRIAFIGNSITYGTGLDIPAVQSYPAQLALMLQGKYGDTCIVSNFAVSGRTMLKNGDYPIWNENEFRNSWNFAPNICFICLGTNDSKPWNWDVYGNQFLGDYFSMIDTFKVRNPLTKFIVCYPPPAFGFVYGIRDSVILHAVLPAVDSIVKKTDAILVDFYHPLLDSAFLFPDLIHPNVEGSRIMAKIVYDKLISTDLIHKAETGLAFITSLTTNKSELRVKDTATLSWITIDADSVFFDGQVVPVNGSLKVAPHENATYTLVAKNEKGTDSRQLEQKIYWPVISKLIVFPYNSKLFQGDSVHLILKYYDQKGVVWPDTVFQATWSIAQGTGYLHNVTDTSVTFVAISAGRSKVQVNVGAISFKAVMTVDSLVNSVNQSFINKELTLFPNPFNNFINLNIETAHPASVMIRIYDLKGTLVKDEHFYISTAGKHIIVLHTEDLSPGIYMYEIEHSGFHFTGKISRQAEF